MYFTCDICGGRSEYIKECLFCGIYFDMNLEYQRKKYHLSIMLEEDNPEHERWKIRFESIKKKENEFQKTMMQMTKPDRNENSMKLCLEMDILYCDFDRYKNPRDFLSVRGTGGKVIIGEEIAVMSESFWENVIVPVFNDYDRSLSIAKTELRLLKDYTIPVKEIPVPWKKSDKTE